MPSISAAPAASDARASLQRRFTTSNDALPNLFPQQTASYEQLDSAAMYREQQLEKKRQDIEALKQKKREFEQELEKFQAKQMREYEELERKLTRDIGSMDLSRANMNAGHMSEPTTPPSERVPDYGFPAIYGRHNRYSSSSMMSPPGATRMGRSGSMMTSTHYDQSQSAQSTVDKLPSKSVPGSRRGSNDRMSAYFNAGMVDAMSQKPAGSSNRYSMPVTASMSAKRMSSMDEPSIQDRHNTAKFLFGDDDDHQRTQPETMTSPGGKTYLQMGTTEDKFPILLRQTDLPPSSKPQSSHAALDLASSDSSSAAAAGGWPSFPRHRQGQQSLPQNLFDPDYSAVTSPSSSSRQSMEISSPPSFAARPTRHSMEAALASTAKNLFNSGTSTPTSRPLLAGMQSAYSTNDIPTMKNTMNLNMAKSPPKQVAEDAFHKHNQSMGRIPPGAVNRSSRDLSNIASKLQETPKEEKNKPSPPQVSTLQASSATFGPSITATMNGETMMSPASPLGLAQYGTPGFYNGYGMQQLMNMGMQPMQLNGQNSFAAAQMFPYQNGGQYNFFPPAMPQNPSPQNNQTRGAGQRRTQPADDGSRFSNVRIENYSGKIYELCKDQHGCRYLQRQLETRDVDAVRMIFDETHEHVVELMTDPFGNYLCQKLLEHATDEQRTTLVNNAAPQMVKIALNQHGTRALQKMIEYISTPGQTQTIVNALRDQVVILIQDLNGNHVIQKCLNRLTAEDAQFIFDAVGIHCVVVGTHRHGCCVLQRCIDHASELQRAALIQHITNSAYNLVQDPFGNYVLQYIVDLKQTKYINPLCLSFKGRIVPLSKHKFSSNVIEKMIRGAEQSMTTMMIDEMLGGSDLESMLKDQFANYVVQTALDYAEVDARQRLVDAIRPMLPAIRQTPYGRRIQSKITATETAGTARPAASNDNPATRLPLGSQQSDLVNSPQRTSAGAFTGLAQAQSFGMPAFNGGSLINGNGLNSKTNMPPFNPYQNGSNPANGQAFAPYQPDHHQNGGFGYF